MKKLIAFATLICIAALAFAGGGKDKGAASNDPM
jgi:hypothetical protein